MELTALKDKICSAFKGSQSELGEILELIEKDTAIFPFNEYEHLICALIEKRVCLLRITSRYDLSI